LLTFSDATGASRSRFSFGAAKPDLSARSTIEAVARKNDNFMAAAARYTSIAMMLPASTFAGYLIGSALDQWLHTTYLTIVFLLLGIASGFLQLIRMLMRDMRKPEK
jgi:F0F1-type ATP synthase assembly protein I